MPNSWIGSKIEFFGEKRHIVPSSCRTATKIGVFCLVLLVHMIRFTGVLIVKEVVHLDGEDVKKGEKDHSRLVVTGRNTPELFGLLTILSIRLLLRYRRKAQGDVLRAV